MLNMDAEGVASMASQGLRLDPPPTEAEIDTILLRLCVAFGLPDALKDEARRILHARFRIRMEMGQTIKLPHTPWLASRKADIDPFYWRRYEQLLVRERWPPLVVNTLGRNMDEVLDLLGNPAGSGAWTRRGLVVGDVQSGKTAAYAALLCKAADAGYRMIVLLTGTLENVRRQTQERLDEAFVGLDSRDFLSTSQLKRKTHVGVGLIDGARDGVVFTSQDKDFRKQTATALNISLASVREPVLVVTKKNKPILESLAGWLLARNADAQGRIDVPLLLVDDEADNASINTRRDPRKTTSINAAIRGLLQMFTKSSYVGFTATPFANIFIDPESESDMLGDDLFPRDFIHLLQPPDNYVGTHVLFAPADPDDHDNADRAAFEAGIRPLTDADDWLPADHRSDHEPGPLCGDVLSALRHFLLSCAVRDLRAAEQGGETGKRIHRSMLVNVSGFTDVQDQVAAQLDAELRRIQEQVRLYGRLAPDKASKSAEISALAAAYEAELSQCGFSWPVVLAALHEAIAPVTVRSVNQRTGAASLDYRSVTQPPGLRVVAVGGNSLSRGLTIEGLSVSCFLRNSRAYDTLLQMGRWFGYRDGYRELCRVFLTDEAVGWYRHVTEATAELKRDFSRMRRLGARPRDFGLRVRTHPDTLLITARNKMATGVDIVGEVRDISLDGRLIETSRLFADRGRNRGNFELADRFLADLAESHGRPERSQNGPALLWNRIPAEKVGRFLREFGIHPQNHDFQGDAIDQALADADGGRDPSLAEWTVAVPTDGEMRDVCFLRFAAGTIEAKKRKMLARPAVNSLLASGRSARVGSRRDVRHGVSPDAAALIEKAWRALNPGTPETPEDEYRAVMDRPLLVLYFLRGTLSNPEREVLDGDVLPALALHFPGRKREDSSGRRLRYRLNLVAQAELDMGGDDEPVDDSDD